MAAAAADDITAELDRERMRREIAQGLRQVADLLEASDDIPVPTNAVITSYLSGTDVRGELVAAARAMGGKADEIDEGASTLRIWIVRRFAGGVELEVACAPESLAGAEIHGPRVDYQPLLFSRPVTARRTGHCHLCRTKVLTGEEIVQLDGSKEWVHVECAETERGPLEEPTPIDPRVGS